MGDSEAGADVRVKDRNYVGLTETGKEAEKEAEGEKPEILNDKCEIAQIDPCAPQKFDSAASDAEPNASATGLNVQNDGEDNLIIIDWLFVWVANQDWPSVLFILGWP